jgi:hypothetical protein
MLQVIFRALMQSRADWNLSLSLISKPERHDLDFEFNYLAARKSNNNKLATFPSSLLVFQFGCNKATECE